MISALTLACVAVVAPSRAGGPLDYKDPKARFELRLEGSWTKRDEHDAPWEACFVDEHGVDLSIHVRPVAAGADVKAAAEASAETWRALKGWRVSGTLPLRVEGRTLLVENATYLAPDPDLPDTDQELAVRLVQAVVGEWLVTIAIQGDPSVSSRLDLVADGAGKGLVPLGTATAAPPKKEPLFGDSDLPRAIDLGAPMLQPFPASFATPGRWRVSHVAGGDAILVSGVESGIVIVHAGLYDSFDPLYARASALLADLGFTGGRHDKPRVDPLGGLQGTTLTSTGTDGAGHALVARARAVLSGNGLGMVAVGFVAPAAIRRLAPRIDEIARTFRMGDVTPDREAMAKLVGQWSLAPSSADPPPSAKASIALAADGTFRASSRPGAEGKSDVESGRFAVLEGALVLSSQRSGSRVVDFALDGEHLRLGGAIYGK